MGRGSYGDRDHEILDVPGAETAVRGEGNIDLDDNGESRLHPAGCLTMVREKRMTQ